MHKAVFLDKDGTLIEDVPYNIDPNKIKFSTGCEKALKLFQARGYKLIIISNQPGIAKGFFEAADLKRFENALVRIVAQFGVHLDGFYYCPHHPQGTVDPYGCHCNCRKPEPGLIKQAVQDHDIDPGASWMIGDILNDIEAGRKAGCKTILIDNGNETEWILSPQRIPNHIVYDLQEAAQIICR